MEALLQDNIWLVTLVAIWTLPWKGYALWTATARGEKRWFIVLLILNTFAILEIIYIFYIVKKTPGEVLQSLRTKI
jgi:hypothetical protein